MANKALTQVQDIPRRGTITKQKKKLTMSLKDSLTLDQLDTVIVPAKIENFTRQFLVENAWHSIRIADWRRPKIKYIAAYITTPTKEITHYAPVASIEPYGDEGKYKLNFSEAATLIGPIPCADAPSGTMRTSRYTSFQKLITAKKLTDLF